VEYADIPENGSVVIMGLGPIGDMSARVAKHRGAGKIIAVELVPERIERARKYGVDVIDLNEDEDRLPEYVKDLTDGRGADAVIDAVGFEAHGSPMAKFMQTATGMLPDKAAQQLFLKSGVDRLNSLYHSIDVVRRGGTISISGVYSGMMDPMPMNTLFDKQIQLRMGQANVKRWVEDILPLLTDDDLLGVDSFATHHLKLEEAPHAYDIFQKKEDGAIKIVFQPQGL